MAESVAGVCAEAVYEGLFTRLSPALYRFLYYRCGDPALAADLVQEAFLRLWENCARVMPDKARAYVYQVGQNAFLKTKARGRVREKYRLRVAPREATTEDPQFTLEEAEFAERLSQALTALPSASREVFLLNRVDGLKYREIAELLGISQKAVEKRMHRALVELRRLHGEI
ncbi:RNA polymerase sigma-70 factor (ECF subfamily) [Lewinella marina]|uniref:RNA polymerase subunit sigma-70 n=1 Tax=Neolewinella marina TaxID=438751 RepID=A0A2G0CJL1_9BACT|nr:sigma-70 family RNA polymerase sigma factor [Neolewinella marina]NJB84671.1 RNA polymerase sigma-70 factor (ECF subfamily) [Neolewinella marina]PHL00156.1 RNA polymerase subunit sigma-70 [Neolewinella marina]